ncbi:hypothetical protein BGZ65_005163 [Modicella reniformis]|uniref:Domain of unknown function at the cortex 1 domain-containing protein n=1 Tax=Modicella reniformis TaxID=1440133 RepID=A0A9P6MLT4_9FUNG|nr:hypothetical protein BGZ65_005163 [Modicella reniformis]
MPGLNTVEHNNIRYRVRVSAGPNSQQLQPLGVNDDANPLLIDTEEFSGHVMFRIKGQDQIQGYEEGQKQDGLMMLKDSPWFQNAAAAGRGENLLSSLQVVGRFKREWSGDQVAFACLFDKPFRLPPLTSIAVKFFKALDPGVQLEVTGPKPYYISPLLSAMNTVNVSMLTEQDQSSTTTTTSTSSPPPPWPSFNGEVITEDTSLIVPEEEGGACLGNGEKEETSKSRRLTIKLKTKKTNNNIITNDPGARRKHFNKAKNLNNHRFLKDHVYSFELFDHFMDCSRFAIKFPGFALDLFKPLNEQPIKYAYQTQDGSVTFLVVVLELVPVDNIPSTV